MALPNIFEKEISENTISRIEELTPETKAHWGKMHVAQMLAHCNVTYEMLFENKHKKPNGMMRLILNLFVKKTVVNEVPYKHNSQTAPQFIISDAREFEYEKGRLISYIRRTQEMGFSAFENKASHSFGVLSATEWNNMLYKHLDHHLGQFGV